MKNKYILFEMNHRNEIRADANMAIKSMELTKNREYKCQDRYRVSLYINTNFKVRYIKCQSTANETKGLR